MRPQCMDRTALMRAAVAELAAKIGARTTSSRARLGQTGSRVSRLSVGLDPSDFLGVTLATIQFVCEVRYEFKQIPNESVVRN